MATLQNQPSYYLYQLSESIADKKYLNSEMVAVESTPLSSLENITFNPIKNAYITFPIDKSFGTQIFSFWNNPAAYAKCYQRFLISIFW